MDSELEEKGHKARADRMSREVIRYVAVGQMM